MLGGVTLNPSEISKKEVSTTGNVVTMLAGLWLIVGIFIDGWAHSNPELVELETFFTPWHGVLYSGFLASALWIGWLIARNFKEDRSIVEAIPRGYGLGLIGVFIFFLGGVGDMTWHIIFGIEENLEQLLSPTHLMLFIGALLILTCPFRAMWESNDPALQHPTLKQFLPALLSLTFAASLCGFFLMYLWALGLKNATKLSYDYFHSNFSANQMWIYEVATQEKGVANFLITTFLFIIPLFIMMIRWRIPFGSITILFTLLSTLMGALDGFSNYEGIIAGAVTGFITDLLVKSYKITRDRRVALRVLSFIIPVVMFSIFFFLQHMMFGIAWSPDLWAGVLVLSGLAAVGVSLIAFPPAYPNNN